MAALAHKSKSPSPKQTLYQKTFLEALSPALIDISKYGIKIVVNGGGSDIKGLVVVVESWGLEGSVYVVWIEGDDVLNFVKRKLNEGM